MWFIFVLLKTEMLFIFQPYLITMTNNDVLDLAVAKHYLLLYLYLTPSLHPFPPVYLMSSEYGFAEKVVEGISLSINSIVIRISAKAFNASFELSQLQVYSVNTSWSMENDLQSTRIQDPQRGEVCIFLYLREDY